MKKLLWIVVLGYLLSGKATAKDYNVILKCQVKFMNKALDFDKSINYFGKSGQTKYFHIIKKEALYFEVHSNWDVYEKDFINWHDGDSISNRFFTRYS